MSRVCSQLRRIYQSKPPATRPATVAPPPTPKPRSPQPTITTAQLYKLPCIDKLTSIIKIRSLSPSFRKNSQLYIYAIDRLARHKRFSAISDIIEAQKGSPDIASEGFATRLIGLYGMTGMFEHAHHLFDELPILKCPRTVLSFNALMAAALHSKEFERVCELFSEYPVRLGVEPDVVSYNVVVKALVERGLVDEAVEMVDEMVCKGLEPGLVTFNTVVDGVYRKKGFEEGEKVWDLMCRRIKGLVPDIKSYNGKLIGMVNEGMVSEAVELFGELKNRGLEPNTFSYNELIRGFCDRGDVEEAKKWYRRLVDDGGLLPNWRTFEILIGVLCENGETELAFELSKSMLGRHFLVDEGLLQMVVDKLVEDSKVKTAQKLVELARANFYYQYSLVMPLVK